MKDWYSMKVTDEKHAKVNSTAWFKLYATVILLRAGSSYIILEVVDFGYSSSASTFAKVCESY
jgi:hypothetical protein